MEKLFNIIIFCIQTKNSTKRNLQLLPKKFHDIVIQRFSGWRVMREYLRRDKYIFLFWVFFSQKHIFRCLYLDEILLGKKILSLLLLLYFNSHFFQEWLSIILILYLFCNLFTFLILLFFQIQRRESKLGLLKGFDLKTFLIVMYSFSCFPKFIFY